MAYSGNPTEYSVAVVYGGTSGEREVSLKSGACCAEALKSIGFSVELIDPASREDLKKLIDGNFDVAFLALHGRGGEDGPMQGFLETIGLPYTGSGLLTSAHAMNKSITKDIFEDSGLPVAMSITVGKDDLLDKADLEEIIDMCGLPCVVKPTTEGSSLGMTIVRDLDELAPALEVAFAVDVEAMVESFISGNEYTVAVLGNELPTALPVLQVIPNDEEFYNFEAKYSAGGSTHICPAPLTEEQTNTMQEIAMAAHMVLGCRGVSRTDIMIDEDGKFWVLETNTLPGMTETSLVPDAARVHGLEFPQLCEALIELALED